jgi:hypothetical protein
MPEKKASKAASPPADAPIPTMGNPAAGFSFVSCTSAVSGGISFASTVPVACAFAAFVLSSFLDVLMAPS